MKISSAKGSSSIGYELLKLLLLLMIGMLPGVWSKDDHNELNCPVCVRMIKAARDFGKAQNPPTATSKALEKYCSLGTTLSVEEQQFCYNIDNVRGEINRMLDMGADEIRVCKKVRSMNPHFCASKSSKKPESTVKDILKSASEQQSRNKRGIIYI